MRMTILTILAGTILSVQGCGQNSSPPDSRKENNMWPPGLNLSKGGIGLVTQGHLYVVVKSTRNELRLKDGNIWTGKIAGTREVVIVFEDRVWSPQDIPNAFDLSKSVIISFEGDIIRFFEFNSKSGGYYKRIPVE